MSLTKVLTSVAVALIIIFAYYAQGPGHSGSDIKLLWAKALRDRGEGDQFPEIVDCSLTIDGHASGDGVLILKSYGTVEVQVTPPPQMRRSMTYMLEVVPRRQGALQHLFMERNPGIDEWVGLATAQGKNGQLVASKEFQTKSAPGVYDVCFFLRAIPNARESGALPMVCCVGKCTVEVKGK